VKENFRPKHIANESFAGIPNDCNPMNQTTYVGKKSYGSKSYKNPIQFFRIKQTLKCWIHNSINSTASICIELLEPYIRFSGCRGSCLEEAV
jgi:hypothetical protein